jgi:hypothetical protein
MPIRRSTRPRRYRRKPAYRRKRMMKRGGARRQRNVHYFKRKCLIGNLQAYNNAGVGTNAAAAYSFNLTQLPQYSDFTGLFDQYSITGVKLDFIPFADNISWEVASNGATIASPGGPLLLATDFDDASAPATANEMLSRQNVRIIPVGRRTTMFLRPKLAEVANSSTTVSRSPGWIDCDTPNSPHYGVKAWMSAPNVPNTNFNYQIYATFYLKVKGVL